MSVQAVSSSIGRRDFLVQTGSLSLLTIAGNSFAATGGKVVIVADSDDECACSPAAQWAVRELKQVLEGKKLPAVLTHKPVAVSDAAFYIVATGSPDGFRSEFRLSGRTSRDAESFSVNTGHLFGCPSLLLAAADARGLSYALLEIADRVTHSAEPLGMLLQVQNMKATPANSVRSIARAFVTDVEDKEWFYDRTFWRNYLSELATQRFNRFSLTFGIGYDFPKGIVGDYIHFLYPYLFAVPGYQVKAVPLSDAERDRNLETLRFITDETKARGLDCQIGIWTHAYQWTDSPHAQHHIDGLSSENHAAYSRDALALLLKTCPAIQGVTLRVHGESGVPEGSYDFWQTLFEAFKKSDRRIEIDMHAKGLDSRMIDIAVNTGMPVKISPKYWAEHLGLAYHQTDIRDLEVPHEEAKEGVFKLSNGARKFLRYGYGDLFQKGRRYDVLFRIWPGTQRMLIWGDPTLAVGYSRAFHFCGSSGVEIFEPLSFKGREGSGLPGGRCGYLDESLKPKEGDWAKFRYTYRVWGRLLYNPKAEPDEWQRSLRDDFGAGAASMEVALGNASRVLPLLTTAHLPSAANNSFWPEVYTNMPIVSGSAPEPYGDTPSPKRFGTVSPLDPALFSTIDEHVQMIMHGERGAKYSPLEVAGWLEDLATKASNALESAQRSTNSAAAPNFRRMEEDIRIQIALGLFFASKLRSGVFYEVYLKSKSPAALEEAVAEYTKARDFWAAMSSRAARIYRSDLSYGDKPIKRGHWADRLPAIEKDLAAMQALKSDTAVRPTPDAQATGAIGELKRKPVRLAPACLHTPPQSFRAGESMSVQLQVTGPEAPVGGLLYYRHVNQGERWRSVQLHQQQKTFEAEIPGDYTQSPYPMQYYFEFRFASQMAALYPGLNSDLNNQPYFDVQFA